MFVLISEYFLHMTCAENTFKLWMDRLGLKSKDVAQALQIEEQTVRHWRSTGVPPRRLPFVQKVMDDWPEGATSASIDNLRTQPLLIQASHEQFRRWNIASLTAGKLIEEWAKDVLEEAADHFALEQEQDHHPRQQQQQPQPSNVEHLALAAETPSKYPRKAKGA